MLEHIIERLPPPDPNRIRCPHCVFGGGPASMFGMGVDEKTGETVIHRTIDKCGFCNGTGFLQRCPTCGGCGGVRQ